MCSHSFLSPLSILLATVWTRPQGVGRSSGIHTEQTLRTDTVIPQCQLTNYTILRYTNGRVLILGLYNTPILHRVYIQQLHGQSKWPVGATYQNICVFRGHVVAYIYIRIQVDKWIIIFLTVWNFLPLIQGNKNILIFSSINEVFLLMVRWNDFKQILHYVSTWPFINTLVTESHWVYENNSSEGHSTQEQKFCDQFSASCPSATHSTLGQNNSPFFIHLSLVKFFWGITFSCEWTLPDE